jgi:hypothetical protein
MPPPAPFGISPAASPLASTVASPPAPLAAPTLARAATPSALSAAVLPAPPATAAPAEAPLMQKVLPHAQASWYLERGLDRVNGFVYKVNDVTHLQTPLRLYEALGLLRAGSLFSPTDQAVHVVRWHAHFSDLYRTPYGDEAGEVPRGSGNIPVYQVGALQLPHGSEIFVIGTDGSRRFVAIYDADRQSWLRARGESTD